jgi:putative nucleotidyltransferase with HDIG domain
MERDQALALLKKHVENINLIKHSLAVEACMKALAAHFNENESEWALAGLLHDLDYAYTLNTPAEHTLKTAQLLAEFPSISPSIIHAIQAHNLIVPIESKMDQALYAVDPTSGFLIACALMHPAKKLAAIDLAFITKRMKEKSFAKGANRQQIQTAEQLGISQDFFFTVCLNALNEISSELGL